MTVRPSTGQPNAGQAGRTCALLVEDDPNIVDLIRSNLAVRGFDTVVSADGARALQLLDTEEPDIVLLDLMLPEADGFELCRLMRERSGVAIIVVSARGGERDKVTALNMGADDYMTKPFSIEELLARIAATLRRTRPAAPEDAAPQLIDVGELQDRPDQRAGVQARRPGAPDAHGVRAAARARDEPRQAAHARTSAAPGLGSWLRDRDGVCSGVCPQAQGQAGRRRQCAPDPDSAASRLSVCAGLAAVWGRQR